MTPSSIAVTATMDVAIGFGRMGERRAKVPAGVPPWGTLHQQIAPGSAPIR